MANTTPCKPDVFHKKYELLETEVECVKSKYGDNPIYSSDLTKHTYPLELIGLTSAKGWREIADTYGDAQVFLLIEEMSELTQSLTKYMRYKGKGRKHNTLRHNRRASKLFRVVSRG